MAGFLTKIKSASSALPNQTSKDALAKKKDDVVFEMTPLERMLQHAGPLREDGSDRFFGFENFGNTWYELLCCVGPSSLAPVRADMTLHPQLLQLHRASPLLF
ncbi:hypothetical protein E4U42_005907 [Claviceps africana]|uniref:Uncharacterized protein n=1 Tax=Claviceps africana TaxID=83212 RepID=A0A8K0JCW5_9HYPO|nr:hypothetical protein E4U42_005907 [Claviceps africana]